MKAAIACGVLLGLTGIPVLAQQARAPACDRNCLDGFIDRYIDAMVNHEVSDDLFARDVKFTENGVRLPLGNEGLWFRISARGTYKLYVPDIETQQIAYFGTVQEKERDQTLIDGLVLRLRIVAGHITEVEQLVIRPEGGLSSNGTQAPRPLSTGERVEKMGAPNPIFAEVIPEARRC